jgi:agmatinase
MVYADLPTFGKAPLVAPDELIGIDLAAYGIPWDQTASLRAGARLGPRRIREQSMWFHEVWNPATTPLINMSSNSDGRRVRSRITMADCGDVTVIPTDTERTAANIRATSKTISTKAFPLMLGGDHYVTYPAYVGFCESHADLTVGIIHIDAHNDLIDNDAILGRHWSGTPIRRAIEATELDPRALAQIGLRGFIGAEEREYQQRHGVYVARVDDVRARGVKNVIREACAQVLAHSEALYLTVDIDAADPSCAPGTCTPVPGGFTSAEFIELLRELGTIREIVALDLVEVAPPLDPTDQTALLAAHALFGFIEERFLRSERSGSHAPTTD